MGNCVCNSKNAFDSPEKRYAGIEQQAPVAAPSAIKLIDPFEQQNLTEATESSHAVELSLLQPITPSTAASSQWSSGSHSPDHALAGDGALVPMSKIQKGRALAARLQKNQRMQQALETSGNPSSGSNATWPLLPPSTPQNERTAISSTIATDGPVTCCVYDDTTGHLYTATTQGTVTRDDGEVMVERGSIVRSVAVQEGTVVTGGDDHACHVTADGGDWSAERLDRVVAVDIRKEDGLIAAGGWDGAVEILQPEGGEAQQRILRDGLVLAVQFGVMGHLAVAGSDKKCGMYVEKEDSTWELAYEVTRPSTVHAVAASSDLWAIASKESVAIMQKGVVLHELEAKRTTDLAWSPSGAHLCVCGEREASILETQNFESVRKVDLAASTAAWGPDALALGAENSTVSILHTAGWEDSGQRSVVVSSSYFSSSANGDWVMKDHVFDDLDGDTDDTQLVSAPPAHVLDEPVTHILTMAFSKGSKYRPSTYFGTSSNNGMVTVRHCSNWKLVAEIQFPALVHTMAFSNGSRYLALGCEDSNVYISDSTRNWELIAKIEFADVISSLCFSGKNNERLAVGSEDGTLAFLTPHEEFDFAGEVEGFEDVGVTAIDWSTKNLAVGRVDGTVAVYDSSNIVKDFYDAVADLTRDTEVVALSFGVSSRFLAVGDTEGSIGIYSAKGGWVLCHQLEVNASVSAVQWCPLGRHLALGDVHGAVKVMDTIFWNDITEAGQSLTQGFEDMGCSLSFSQDGKLLAFGGADAGFGVLDSSAEWALVVNQLSQRSSEENDSNAPHEV